MKDYWTIIFSVISIILFNFALFIPEQRMIILGFCVISIIFSVILFYIAKVNSNERTLKHLEKSISKLDANLTEKFNYLKDIYNLKVEIAMLKKNKKAQINLMDFVKIIVAVILIYVMTEVIKSLP